MKRINVIALATMVALLFTACPNPVDNAGGGSLTIDVTDLALSNTGMVYLQVNGSRTLSVTVTPEDANSGINWRSLNTSVATVDSSGTVTGHTVGTAEIRVESAVDPSIYSSCTVEVVASMSSLDSDFTLLNMPDVAAGTTSSLPGIVDGKVILTNTTPDGAVNSSGLDKATILYYNTAFDGDFRIKARVLMSDPAGVLSSNRGVLMGAIAGNASGGFDASSPFALMMKRTRGDVRSYYHKGDGTIGAASPSIADGVAINEYIYEVKRDGDSITYSVFVSTTGELIEANDVSNVDELGAANLATTIIDGNALHPAFIVTGATATISNIEIWSGTGDAELLEFYTEEIAGSPVPVTGVTVSGPQRNPDEIYDYQNSLAAAQADTIQLTAEVTPSLSDDPSVTWSSEPASVATVNANGLVSILTAGTVTITATTNDSGFIDTYSMNITASDVPVSSISIAGDSSVMVGLTTALTATVVPTDSTLQTVTWSSDDAGIASVDPETGVVTGEAVGGPVDIIATANDGSGVTARHSITVTAAESVVFSWAVPEVFDATSGPVTVSERTITYRSTSSPAVTVSGIDLANARFNIGTHYNDNGAAGGTEMDTSDLVNVPDGEFNFTQPATVTVTYSSDNGGGNFYLYVNNNTTSSGNSVLGSASRLSPNEDLVAAGGTATFTVDPAAFGNHESLATAFLQLRADSSKAIMITSISVAYD